MNIRNLSLLLFLLLFPISTWAQSGKGNALRDESSPYLLQHAQNPVNWYPWGDDALEKAQREDKLMLISIGYAACHWCHVMERESFQDAEVARWMNENMVSVKVDREERPDVDKLYMNAFQLLSEETGWPLNAIALPDGSPVYVVGYLPKEQWIKTLQIFANGYQNQREKIEAQAKMLTEGVRGLSFSEEKSPQTAFTPTLLDRVFQQMQPQLDTVLGGMSGAPKFPMPVLLHNLLAYQRIQPNPQAKAFVEKTLDEVALGGLYDQLGGGFARYATDEKWRIPHFEKMLYDNALLVSVYADAYRINPKPLYKQVVEETLAFAEREWRTKNGLFQSATGAISEDEEGKFYLWEAQEIEHVLGDDAAAFSQYYEVTEVGDWKGTSNVLHIDSEDYSPEKSRQLAPAREALFAHRETRTKPAIDDKLLTGWNALMLQAYCRAYRAFGEPEYLAQAEKMAAFFLKQVKKDGFLKRNYQGKREIHGFLEDYAYLIQGLIELYQVTFQEQYLHEAKALTETAVRLFGVPESPLFYYARQEDEQLVAPNIETADDILPASNAVMCRNLQLLGWYFEDAAMQAQASEMLDHILPKMLGEGAFYASWLSPASWLAHPPYEIGIVGEDAERLRQVWAQTFHPNVLLLGGKQEGSLTFLQNKHVEGETLIYVCRNHICKMPVQTVEQAVKLME